jgi:hypothetical protein
MPKVTRPVRKSRVKPKPVIQPEVTDGFDVTIKPEPHSIRQGYGVTFYKHGPSHGFTITDLTRAEIAIVHRILGEFLGE